MNEWQRLTNQMEREQADPEVKKQRIDFQLKWIHDSGGQCIYEDCEICLPKRNKN